MCKDLLDLCVRFAHKIEDQEQTIEVLEQTIEELQSCLEIANNDYKKCYAENIRLSEENNQLKFRNKC